jgi:uncharacterized membrane protein YraQ (UPF0718 family)
VTDRAGKNAKGELLKPWASLAGIVALAAALMLICPDRRAVAAATTWDYLREMVLILPAVMVMMGLFSAFVSREQVARYLGAASGIKGLLLAVLLGSLPTGPLYVAFPLAAALLKKGARVSSVIVFLSAWACIKIPQEMVEIQFLGLKFMALRLLLTIAFVIPMGILIERLVVVRGNRAPAGGTGEEGGFDASV